MTTTARTMTRRIATDSAAIAALVINGPTVDLCLECGGTTYCADDCDCDDCLEACDMCGTPTAELTEYTATITVGDHDETREVRICDGCANTNDVSYTADYDA